MPYRGIVALTLPELDLAVPDAKGSRPPFSTTAALLERLDAMISDCRAALVASSDDAMQAMWTLKFGSTVFFSLSRIADLRTTVLNPVIHHRGQLTVYLRMLDVPLPDLYGTTADTKRG